MTLAEKNGTVQFSIKLGSATYLHAIKAKLICCTIDCIILIILNKGYFIYKSWGSNFLTAYAQLLTIKT